MTKSELKKRDWIAGLERGLAILESFDNQHPRMTATQAAERSGLTLSAARRYLLTLEHLGYLYSDGRHYGLTPRVLKVGWSYFDSAALPRLLLPFLQRASAAINESVYVSVLDNHDLVFIAKNGVTRLMTTGFVLGARVPAHLVSPGIAMLAALPEEDIQARLGSLEFNSFTPHTLLDAGLIHAEIEKARAAGYAVLEQQLQVGVRGIAVPLKNRSGKVVAAMSVSLPMLNEKKEAAVARVLPVFQEIANTLISYL